MTKASEPLYKTGIFALFSLLGLVYTWPLASYFFEGIPYAYYPDPARKILYMLHGDHLQAYYHIGLLKLAVTGAIEWFSNPFEFATIFTPFRETTYFLPISIFYLPFSFISEPMAYNILVILSFGLCGLSMYLWVYQLTGSRLPALAGGFVFNFVPVRFVELLGGHPAGHAIFLVPLTLFFFDRAVSRRSAAYSAYGGLSAFALSVQYGYFAYYLLMFLIVYIPWRLIPSVWSSLNSGSEGKNQIRRLAVAGIPFALGLLAVVWNMLKFKSSVVGKSSFAGGRTMAEIKLYSPTLSALWDWQLGWSMYIGFALIAALAGLAFGLLSTQSKIKKRDALFFGVVFIVTYTLAFGATLDDTIPLYSVFYNYFPYFSFSRTPAKIMVLVVTVLSPLVGYSIVWAMTKPKAMVIAAILLAVVAVDYHPKANIGISLLDENNEIYRRVAKEADGKYVLDLPIWPGESSWSSIYIYYTLQSRVPSINGYSPVVSRAYIDNVFKKLWPLDSGDLTEKHMKILRDLNVGLIVFHEEAYPGKISAYPSSFALNQLLTSPYLTLIEKNEPLWLFKLNDKPGAAAKTKTTSPVGNFYQVDHLGAVNGERVKDPEASNGLAMAGFPKKEAKGELILNQGPYRTFPSGAYRAVFRIKSSDNDSAAPVAKIDVASDEGRIVIAEKVINASDFETSDRYQDFTLEFTLTPDKPWILEFRTYLMGRAPVFVDNVYIIRADQADPLLDFEAERMFYTGRIIEDREARGGKAIMSSPLRDPNDAMMIGPFRSYEAGDYTARLRLKSSPAGKDDLLAKIAVISRNENKTIAEREIYIGDLPAPDKYGEVALRFSLKRKDVIEFKVIYNGKSRFYADSVSIDPAP
ncbi:hypothetical protein MNBD_NITROSPINAE04-70 [hydrothermal vent metagenome]|uniref:Uncharacterized protein n=1 Tax=hydrothermal vent metagenome TaxID=652676 RepID=A0A3B1CUI0_9ZZZZ